jgi:predicted Fe-Mo cluster-binding NifX family protein
MKIAFSTNGTSREDLVDSRFGRAERFVIIDSINDELQVVDNIQNRQSSQGAGIQSATTLINQGVGAVVTGQCGPKAFTLLERSGIRVYPCPAITIAEAFRQVQQNQLSATASATVEGHWGEA